MHPTHLDNIKYRDLLAAYGFTMAFERPEEHKTRYQGEHTFIDLWLTHRGVTMGIYNPRSKSVRYVRPRSPEQFEQAIIDASKLT